MLFSLLNICFELSFAVYKDFEDRFSLVEMKASCSFDGVEQASACIKIDVLQTGYSWNSALHLVNNSSIEKHSEILSH